MSDTRTAPQGGADPVAELLGDDYAAESAATEREAPAPATEGAATDPAETTTDPRVKPEDEATDPQKPSRADRRIAAMSARLAEQGRELDALRRAQQQPPRQPEAMPQTPEELERLVDQRAGQIAAARAAQERAERFHAEGRKAHADWNERCQSLMQMGADAGMAEMLIELPDGARVAGALADDPEALERIAAIKTERGRAISLGMYAASLESKPTPPVRRPSNAPTPIRPLNGGQQRAEFNEYTATPDQLRDYYDLQAKKARGLA